MAAPRIRPRLPQTRRATARANGRPPSDPTTFTGPARLGKRTKRLVKRIGAEDIAIIDHAGIDRVSGEDLVACGVKHVINVATSVAPHYANRGPSILVDAGVILVDMPGAPLFDVVKDGDRVTLDGGRLLRDGELIHEGEVLDRERVDRAYEEAERRIGEALEAFAENTMTHI